jgi:glycosyltransferase involved in cell wall biosynthesis
MLGLSAGKMDPMSHLSPFSVSIIVEWENAHRDGAVRADALLDALRQQLHEAMPRLIDRTEILIVFDVAQISQSDVRAAIERVPRAWDGPVRYLAAPDGSYYGQKNYGARHATGELLLFLDSDVVPYPGWLEGLIAPFAEPTTEIVAGTTSVSPTGLYSAAMALGWLFPLRQARTDIVPWPLFYANNVAFRATLFAQRPFPDAAGYRSQIGLHLEQLNRHGHVILMNFAAGVDHSPPGTLRQFVSRALWSGYDAALRLRRSPPRRPGSGTLDMARDAVGAILRVARDYRKVGLDRAGAAAASAILACYHAIRFAGFLSSLVRSDGSARAFRRIDS